MTVTQGRYNLKKVGDSMTEAQIRENLKKFRMRKNPKAPYTVFSDQALDLLLKYKPKNMESLTAIKGFPAGGSRVEKYGKDIIEFFKNGCKVEDMGKF